ncbi:RNA polymerase sigma factor [Dermatobacter hominis]|uniref:RNA polymerase sigma factor n=1 Tax=Dermatobacter hominis TaxID=2884263 RepID=UPI001D123B3A|nr:sigma-70 family RNA polymerase sigma factor [Dermatobacter hominis]UDY35128.1 sigma-70 family RNA polymerase sigma factor [Dermatobacter hominis]
MTADEAFETLLTAVQRGDEAAAAALYRRVQPRLVRYLRFEEPQAADDIAADVWVAIAAKIGDFEGGEDGFRAWAFTIARRRVIDHRRRGMRRRTSSASPESFVDRADHTDGSDPSSSLDSQDAVDRIVALLPPVQAEVVLLRVVADLDAETVARMLGRSANWVRVTQHRALKKLAEQLRRPTDVTP